MCVYIYIYIYIYIYGRRFRHVLCVLQRDNYDPGQGTGEWLLLQSSIYALLESSGGSWLQEVMAPAFGGVETAGVFEERGMPLKVCSGAASVQGWRKMAFWKEGTSSDLMKAILACVKALNETHLLTQLILETFQKNI